MAELVLGLGTSHSPMVSMDGPSWLAWGERDQQHRGIYDRDGKHLSYEQARQRSTAELAAKATPERAAEGAARVATAVDVLRTAVAHAALDVLVVVGDDQDEHLLAKNLPPFLVYWGDTIPNRGLPADFDQLPTMFRQFLPHYHEVDGTIDYPVAVDLAEHLIATAYDCGFDVATSNELPEDRGMGHAFAFPLRAIARRTDLPIVPVMVNTYNPPAQPRATRCRDFGHMLRQAIDSLPSSARVGVVASGGLSHFLVLEELDRQVLDHLAAGDLDALCAIPEPTLQSGTSEIKNWVTVAACLEDFEVEVVDYVPGYRTEAGTGTGLAFALWRPQAATGDGPSS